MKRRLLATEDQTYAFIHNVTRLKEQDPPDRIIVIDETNRRTVGAGFLILSVKGVESVQCRVANDDNEGAMVTAAISAAGEKLPLTVIRKGETPRFLAHDQLLLNVWAYHGELDGRHRTA